MGSSAKIGTFFIKGSQELKTYTCLGPKHKVPFGMEHPPACTSNLVYMCAEGFRGHKSSTEFNYLDSFTFYSFYNLGFFSSRGAGQVGEGVSGDIEGFSYMHTCMCICTHAHTCNTKNYMLRNCKWPLPWRQPCSSWLTCMGMCVHMYLCMHTCVHVHAYVYKCGTDTTHPHPHPPPYLPRKDPPKTV